ncbi:MAG TPA: hypothetical protein DD381_03140 [Lentisphaeria bacterium]|nr:MAG: hypothetical protein A2X47_03110 [Lentisphaerae bacterium GWF2_38_69]HBM15328.1 hypothetical protein [Lentisphaeria bacterium]
MNRKQKIKHFTLIEVVVALAILTGGIMGSMAIVSMSKNRMDKAYDSFFAQHMLSQAAEYYLLCGNKPITPDFFSYSGYSAYCIINDCRDNNIPMNTGSNWKLVTYDISIRGPNGRNISSVKIDKLIKNEIF